MAFHFTLSKSQSPFNDLQDSIESSHTHIPLNLISYGFSPHSALPLIAFLLSLRHARYTFISRSLHLISALLREFFSRYTHIAGSSIFSGPYSSHLKFIFSLRPFLFESVNSLSHYLSHRSTKSKLKQNILPSSLLYFFWRIYYLLVYYVFYIFYLFSPTR